MTVPFWIHFRKGANSHQGWGKGTAHSFNMHESTGRWHIKPKYYWKASFLYRLQMRCDVRENPLWALFTSFLALWWVTELQGLLKGKAETVAENKKETVRRKGTKGRERRKETRNSGRERQRKRESWHCHFRSARQPTLCHHDNGETSYPAGKQGCPGRRGEGKVVMGKKKNREREREKKNRAIKMDEKWVFANLFMRKENRERQR